MMDAYLDQLLDELVAAEPREQWSDVRARARRPRRRYTAVVAAVAVLVLAPATWAAVNAFEGTPAPRSIKQSFVEWNANAVLIARNGFRKHAPKAIASKAHGVIQVQTADGPLDLWAAPARGGGACYFIGWQSELRKTHAFGESSCVPAAKKRSARIVNVSWGGDYLHRSYEVLEGYAYGAARTVRVALADGRTKTLPVVEGFFLGVARRGAESLRSHRGIRVVSITARDAHGKVVGRWRLQER
jgi:hypothetical protein